MHRLILPALRNITRHGKRRVHNRRDRLALGSIVFASSIGLFGVTLADGFDRSNVYGQSCYLGEGLSSEFWKAKHKNVTIMEMEDGADDTMKILTKIRNEESDSNAFKEHVEEAIELLIDQSTVDEEPEEIEIVTGSGYKYTGLQTKHSQDVIVISIVQVDQPKRIMDLSHLPSVSSSGYVLTNNDGRVVRGSLPPMMKESFVILLEPQLIDASRLQNVIDYLSSSSDGTSEDFAICTILADPKAIDTISKDNKDVPFVVMAVEMGVDDETGKLCPGCGDFNDRYFK